MARGLEAFRYVLAITAAISVVASWFVACARSRARARRGPSALAPPARGPRIWHGIWAGQPIPGARNPVAARMAVCPMACAGADCAAPTAPTGGARPTARAGAAGAAAALGDVLVRSRMSKNQHNRFTRLGPSLLSRDP